MRIHQFNGKESGLMVFGSATELRKLGEQLQTLAADKPEFNEANLPQQLVSIPINPSTDFSLSFHIDTKAQNQPASNVPESEIRKTVFFVLTIVGFIGLVRWGLSYVL